MTSGNVIAFLVGLLMIVCTYIYIQYTRIRKWKQEARQYEEQNTLLRKLNLMLLPAAILLLMTSCQSPRTEYYVPEIEFPQFPELHRTIQEDGSWLVPKQDVDALAAYYLQIQTTQAVYEQKRRLYLQGEKK